MGEQINTENQDDRAGGNDAATPTAASKRPRKASSATRRTSRARQGSAAKETRSAGASSSSGESSEVPGRRYRPHAQVPRRHQIKVLVDEDEWALLDSAAGQVGGLSVAGWLGLVASDAAASRPLISGEQYGRVWELTRALRRVGVNLNQIAAKCNAGGGVEGLELVASLAALDQVLGQSSELLRVMTEVMRSPRRAGAGHRGSAATKADQAVGGGADATGGKAASVPGDAAGGGSAR